MTARASSVRSVLSLLAIASSMIRLKSSGGARPSSASATMTTTKPMSIHW